MRNRILIWLIISTVCWIVSKATAAELLVDDQKLIVVDAKGQTVTKLSKSSFLLSRVEMQTSTVALAEYQDQKKLLAAAGVQRETIVAQLVGCQRDRDVLDRKLSKRLVWIIASGASGLAIGVVFGVLVK